MKVIKDQTSTINELAKWLITLHSEQASRKDYIAFLNWHSNNHSTKNLINPNFATILQQKNQHLNTLVDGGGKCIQMLILKKTYLRVLR
ncbi:MAG: hypothetical protein IR526_00890 [Bordetella sp.]|nr:MAG: hypothetical protein IR526_00890 [Bordetella sp.]